MSQGCWYIIVLVARPTLPNVSVGIHVVADTAEAATAKGSLLATEVWEQASVLSVEATFEHSIRKHVGERAPEGTE